MCSGKAEVVVEKDAGRPPHDFDTGHRARTRRSVVREQEV